MLYSKAIIMQVYLYFDLKKTWDNGRYRIVKIHFNIES